MQIKDGLQTSDEKIRSFLMIGQSNMAGRGELSDVEQIVNPQCYMLRMGRWQRMEEPVNPDRPIFSGVYHSGISMASSFADAVANTNGCRVGMIPCADGGTRVAEWMPGEILFDHAVMMTELAKRTSRLAGILWHQGESDCHGGEAEMLLYKERLLKMFSALRERIGCVPLLIGELAYRYGENTGIKGHNLRINELLHQVAAELPCCGIVSAAGLSMKPDGLHFDARAQREFGRRYAAVYAELARGDAG